MQEIITNGELLSLMENTIDLAEGSYILMNPDSKRIEHVASDLIGAQSKAKKDGYVVHKVEKNGNHFRVLGSWTYKKGSDSKSKGSLKGWEHDSNPPKAISINEDIVNDMSSTINKNKNVLQENSRSKKNESIYHKVKRFIPTTVSESNDDLLDEGLIDSMKNLMPGAKARQRRAEIGRKILSRNVDRVKNNKAAKKAIKLSGEEDDMRDPTGHGRDYFGKGQIERDGEKTVHGALTKYTRNQNHKTGDKNNRPVRGTSPEAVAKRKELTDKYSDKADKIYKQIAKQGDAAREFLDNKTPESKKRFMTKSPVKEDITPTQSIIESISAGKIRDLKAHINEAVRQRIIELSPEIKSIAERAECSSKKVVKKEEPKKKRTVVNETFMRAVINGNQEYISEKIELMLKERSLELIRQYDKELKESHEFWNHINQSLTNNDRKWEVMSTNKGQRIVAQGGVQRGSIQSNPDGSFTAHYFDHMKGNSDVHYATKKEVGTYDDHGEALDAIMDHHEASVMDNPADNHYDSDMKEAACPAYDPNCLEDNPFEARRQLINFLRHPKVDAKKYVTGPQAASINNFVKNAPASQVASVLNVLHKNHPDVAREMNMVPHTRKDDDSASSDSYRPGKYRTNYSDNSMHIGKFK